MTKPKEAKKPSARARADQASADSRAAEEAKAREAELLEERDADAICRAARFNPEALGGELGDFIVSRMKAAAHMKPWEQMSEEEQRTEIDAAKDWAKRIIAGVVEGVSTKGLPHRAVKLGKFSGAVGETSVEVKATMVLDQAVGARLSGGVTDAVLVFASEEAFLGGTMTTKAEPDEPGLALEGGGDAPDGEVEHDEDGVIKDPPPPAADPAPAPAPAPAPSA